MMGELFANLAVMAAVIVPLFVIWKVIAMTFKGYKYPKDTIISGNFLYVAALSVFLSVASYFMLFLFVPIFILPPLAFYVGLQAYKTFVFYQPQAIRVKKALASLPMILGIAIFIFEIYLINSSSWH